MFQTTLSYKPSTIWRFPKIGIPQIIHLTFGFSIIIHPFWGSIILGNFHIVKNLHTKTPLTSQTSPGHVAQMSHIVTLTTAHHTDPKCKTMQKRAEILKVCRDLNEHSDEGDCTDTDTLFV